MGAAYMEGPKVDSTALTFYEYVNQIGNRITGQRDFMEKNFTRGGGQAFTELLGTTEGMARLQWTILEMMFIESLYDQALIFLQSGVGQQGVNVRQRRTNKTTGKEQITDITVTEDDLVHGYEVSLDLGEKKRFGAMESQNSMAVYDRKIASPYFNHAAVSEDMLCSSPEEAERQLKAPEEIQRIQNEQQQLTLRERAARLAGQQPGAAPAAVPAVAGATAATPGGQP